MFALQWSKQLFVNDTEIYKSKAKDSEIVATPLCLGNISKDWSVDNMKKIRFNAYVSINNDLCSHEDVIRQISSKSFKK